MILELRSFESISFFNHAIAHNPPGTCSSPSPSFLCSSVIPMSVDQRVLIFFFFFLLPFASLSCVFLARAFVR